MRRMVGWYVVVSALQNNGAKIKRKKKMYQKLCLTRGMWNPFSIAHCIVALWPSTSKKYCSAVKCSYNMAMQLNEIGIYHLLVQ